MALSNIFREPRREITESMLGISVFTLVVAGPLAIAWDIASAMVAQDPHMPFALALLLIARLRLDAAMDGNAIQFNDAQETVESVLAAFDRAIAAGNVVAAVEAIAGAGQS